MNTITYHDASPKTLSLRPGTVVLDAEKTKFYKRDAKSKKTLRALADNYTGDELFRRASNIYRKKVNKKSRPLRNGEHHFGTHNFTGIGTVLDKQGLSAEPINRVDAIAKEHDIGMKKATNKSLVTEHARDKLRTVPPSMNGYFQLNQYLNKLIKNKNVN